MKLEKRKLAMIVIIALATASFGLVNAIPSMPHKFYGSVTIDGLPAPDGIFVDAYIDGVMYEWTTTSDGSFGWDGEFQVPGDDSDTPSYLEGGVDGDYIDFYVDDIYATSYVFVSGSITYIDLEISTDAYEIQLYYGWNLIGIPFIPEDPSIEVMLSDIIDYVEVVWSYDAATWTWSSYSPWVPLPLCDLTEMTDGKGYWIYVTADVLWMIT